MPETKFIGKSNGFNLLGEFSEETREPGREKQVQFCRVLLDFDQAQTKGQSIHG